MKTYTIIGGVNGVGKSSFSGALRNSDPKLGVIIDVDKLTAEKGGNAVLGGKAALRMLRDCLENGVSFTQETTLSGYLTAQTAKKAAERGYEVRLFYLGLDTAAESLERIRNRVRRGGHDIASEDVLRRFEGRWASVARVLPFCTQAEFFDNDNGFRKVAEFRNGELLPVGDERPGWILDFQSWLRENR